MTELYSSDNQVGVSILIPKELKLQLFKGYRLALNSHLIYLPIYPSIVSLENAEQLHYRSCSDIKIISFLATVSFSLPHDEWGMGRPLSWRVRTDNSLRA